VLAVVEAQSLLGEPCMQRVEVAAWLGVSPQRVTQIEQRAAEKIRAALGEVVER
jgi:DNA-directed RNA polymerase sigma subunit (sigma70/sigma32)